jgi:hypothetical protein
MGVVYRGIDVKLERPVAIKVLPEALADVADVRERFLREARTAAKLSHQNIVPIYRADDMHGVVFIVMAFVDGESLGEALATRAPFRRARSRSFFATSRSRSITHMPTASFTATSSRRTFSSSAAPAAPWSPTSASHVSPRRSRSPRRDRYSAPCTT